MWQSESVEFGVKHLFYQLMIMTSIVLVQYLLFSRFGKQNVQDFVMWCDVMNVYSIMNKREHGILKFTAQAQYVKQYV